MKIEDRFKAAYYKVYGIHPEVVKTDGFYRSPHLPMPMKAVMLQRHIQRLETRAEEPTD